MSAERIRWVGDAVEALRQQLSLVPGLELVTSAPYIFRAALILFVLGIVGGLVGVLVNLRSLEFNAEATVHGVFPGIVVGALWGGTDAIIPGAACVAVIIVVALSIINKKKNTEAGTAVILTSFYALGMVISLWEKDMSGQLEALMFGRLLEVNNQRLTQALIVIIVALIVIMMSWRRQVFFAFDRSGAQASGLNPTVADILINTAIAGVVVAASSAIGVLLVIGYIVIPGAAARLISTKISTMCLLSIAIGIFAGWLGLVFMHADSTHPISPQAAVALSMCALYALALLIRGIKKAVSA